MERIEIAVVGGGPAGATAARFLAERGARVVLFEARQIPRHKLCGGALTPKAMPYLGGASEGAVTRTIERMELAGARVPSLHLRLPEARIAMVERAPFDQALVEAAAAAGTEVRDRWPVQDLLLDEGGVTLRGPRGEARAAILVAADGDPSRIGQRLDIGGVPARRSLALEVDLPFAPGRRRDELQLRFGVPGGYAWYFPKADHANVGILSRRAGRQAGLRDALQRYARELGLDLAGARVQGHWIPQALRRRSTVRGRVLLVGDAAATCDPFFGEGISFAMASAVIATRTIDDWASGRIANLDHYDRRLRLALGPAMRRARLVADVADLAPSASLIALRLSGWLRGETVRAVAGDGWPFTLPVPPAGPSPAGPSPAGLDMRVSPDEPTRTPTGTAASDGSSGATSRAI